MHECGGVGVRWTVGDVSDRGFEALRLSIWGARRVFGSDAGYVVCVNTIGVDEARVRTGDVPEEVRWHEATGEMPAFLKTRLDEQMAEGVGWKLAPLRIFPERYEISLDNDCILWGMPQAMERWLAGSEGQRCLMAEDVRACFGQFAKLCGSEPRNAGIRGLPPGFDLEEAIRRVLNEAEGVGGKPMQMASELDEQGLQTAALSQYGEPLTVTLQEVTVCSPFHPHRPELGRCGAHFVGLNARHIAWDYHGRPADEWMTLHWERHRPALYERTGARRGGIVRMSPPKIESGPDTACTQAGAHKEPDGSEGIREHGV